MKIEEPESMKEVREIRRKIWEEIKDMTPQEQVNYFNEKGDRFEKESGIKLRRLQKAANR